MAAFRNVSRFIRHECPHLSQLASTRTTSPGMSYPVPLIKSPVDNWSSSRLKIRSSTNVSPRPPALHLGHLIITPHLLPGSRLGALAGALAHLFVVAGEVFICFMPCIDKPITNSAGNNPITYRCVTVTAGNHFSRNWMNPSGVVFQKGPHFLQVLPRPLHSLDRDGLRVLLHSVTSGMK